MVDSRAIWMAAIWTAKVVADSGATTAFERNCTGHGWSSLALEETLVTAAANTLRRPQTLVRKSEVRRLGADLMQVSHVASHRTYTTEVMCQHRVAEAGEAPQVMYTSSTTESNSFRSRLCALQLSANSHLCLKFLLIRLRMQGGVRKF